MVRFVTTHLLHASIIGEEDTGPIVQNSVKKSLPSLIFMVAGKHTLPQPLDARLGGFSGS